MDTTINQRIKQIADKLCHGKISELAKVSGVNQSALRDIIGIKQRKPGFEILHKIVDNSTLNINGDWLLIGKGPMLKNEISVSHNLPSKKTDSTAIPVYNIQAAGSLKALFEKDNPYLLDEIVLLNAPNCDGAIYVREESMYPLIKGDDIAVYKQLHSIDNLLEGDMYIVDCKIGDVYFLVIKYVKWEEKNISLRLVSYNKHYDDIIISVDAVRAIAFVKSTITIGCMI